MARHKDLQPWLDYFEMLHIYEKKGFLQIDAEKHEAYITQPALYTLTPGGFEAGDKTLSDIGYIRHRVASGISIVVRRLRVYAAWKSQGGNGYDRYAFAVHMVKPDEPHDLLHTIVLTTHRPWWKLWMKHDHFDVISY